MSANVAAGFEPRQVLLFSGHRVDVPGRMPPRFPAAKVAPAAAAIERALVDLGVGPSDLALTQGSSGGDLLFAESCLQLGVRVALMLPGSEAQFIEESVRASVDGEQWVQRYRAIRASLCEPPRMLAKMPGDAPGNRFERCNQWLLKTALAWGRERLRFVCLWDGAPSGGPGGTADLVDAVREEGLPVIWLDARLL